MTRKELKQPDAFQQRGGELSSWLIARRKTVVTAVVVTLVACFGLALASYVSSRSEAAASKKLGGALAVLERPVEATPTGTPEPGKEPFKTEKEKEAAAAKVLADFRSENPGSRAAAVAALALGQTRLREGKADEALTLYDEYLKAATVDDPLRAAALEGRGYALEAKGDFDGAIGAFGRLAEENKTDFMKGMGLYHRGRMLSLKGQKEEAAKAFAEIPGTAPGTAAARLALERLTALAAEGVKTPPPAVPKGDAG